MHRMNEIFGRFASKASLVIGHPVSNILCFVFLVVWLAFGPACHWSESWQIVMGTVSAVLTLMIAFLIQNTQNRAAEQAQRNTEAIHAKLDALIAVSEATNELIGIEARGPEELAAVRSSGCPPEA